MSKKIILSGRSKLLEPLITQILAVHQLLDESGLAKVYGIPTDELQDEYEFQPQIKLMFYQSRSEATPGFPPATGEITYRVMGETSETFTEANAKLRANRIKALFVDENLFEWQKGTELYSYADKPQGYLLKVFARNETAARNLITKVIAIENKTPGWDKLTKHITEKTFPVDPGTITIMGETYKKPRRRPREDVTFRYAELHLWGRPNPVTLLDTTGRRGKALLNLLRPS